MALPPVALMLVVGLWGITREGTLWGDEAVTYEMARRTVPEIWRTLGSVDAVHGLYYLLMHGLFAVFGPGLVPLRLPSVLGMCLTAGGVALIGRRLAGPRAGLLAGLVVPLLPVVQRFAQEGRSYALVCGLVTWGTWLLLKRSWAAYAVVMLTACLLHEFAVLAVVAHGVTVRRGVPHARPEPGPGGADDPLTSGPGGDVRDARDARDPRASGPAVPAGPAVPSGARRVSGVPGPRARLALSRRGTRGLPRGWLVAAGCVTAGLAPLALFSTTQSSQVEWIGRPGVPEVVPFLLIALLGRACARTEGGSAVRAVALPLLVVPTALLMAVSFVHPLFVDRYVLPYVIGLALLLGAVLDRYWSGLLAVATAAAALITLAVHGPHLRSPDSRKNDVGAVAAAVDEIARPGDGLLFTPARRRVWTLAHPEPFRRLGDVSLGRSPRSSGTLFGVEAPPPLIRARMLAPGVTRLIVLQDLRDQPLDDVPAEEVKREVLRESFTLCEERLVGQARIGIHVRTGTPCP
ncbi:hypothetical protein ACFYT4_05590 [Streptomyces sp. NPDC004609]|uniref:hypothetical protein n=1 Tax=Streptomyces sp. NPDC004609 TaxID=3364704 RepID=UPI0036B2591D